MTMEYSIFKLSFKSPVHFGNGRLSKSGYTFCADTLFSAMYKEAIKLYGGKEADRLRILALGGELLISDSMPYHNDTLYLPKPIIHISGERESNSSMKKQFKKLQFIPVGDMEAFLRGDYDPSEALDDLKCLGVSGTAEKSAVFIDKDSEPYSVGTFTFDSDNGYGSYIIFGGSDEAYDMMYDIMDSLSYTGIGGKISSGYGSFEYTYESAADEMKAALEEKHNRYMSLSVSMAADEEQMAKAVSGSYYELIKRSGFVSSETYSDNQIKKRDFYCFKSGSCFSDRFTGSVFDVSDGGRHSVYRYAVPMFYGFE